MVSNSSTASCGTTEKDHCCLALNAMVAMTEPRGSVCNVYADGLLIMHHGKVKFEYLLPGIPQWQTHALNSSSKVFTGCVAAILADQGKLDWQQPLHTYVDELKGTGAVGSVVHRHAACGIFVSWQFI